MDDGTEPRTVIRIAFSPDVAIEAPPSWWVDQESVRVVLGELLGQAPPRQPDPAWLEWLFRCLDAGLRSAS